MAVEGAVHLVAGRLGRRGLHLLQPELDDDLRRAQPRHRGRQRPARHLQQRGGRRLGHVLGEELQEAVDRGPRARAPLGVVQPLQRPEEIGGAGQRDVQPGRAARVRVPRDLQRLRQPFDPP
ncbi:hypothetical protein ACFY71_13825 [Streptomyces cinerochromogenes]|uniref:hypothetical protein n=1 Tax=Streptomyces cinerochromogenes TaxID=66422 RepID=UPI0036AFF064